MPWLGETTRGTSLQKRAKRKPQRRHRELTAGVLLSLHSSEQSAKADTHKELVRTLKELKVHLPADKKAKGRASTLATLKYALRSVKQVKGTSAHRLLPTRTHKFHVPPHCSWDCVGFVKLSPDTAEGNVGIWLIRHDWKPQFIASLLLHLTSQGKNKAGRKPADKRNLFTM